MQSVTDEVFGWIPNDGLGVTRRAKKSWYILGSKDTKATLPRITIEKLGGKKTQVSFFGEMSETVRLSVSVNNLALPNRQYYTNLGDFSFREDLQTRPEHMLRDVPFIKYVS